MQKIIGSILIVAGTTIGAGMLAMPIISANVGFTFMTFILFCIWFAMYYTSILLVDVYKYNSPSDGLNTLTFKYLGNTGAIVTAISMLTLMYALVSAYITGGGDILRTNLEQWLGKDISAELSAVLFALLFGGIIAFGTKIVDLGTKVVFSIKLIFLCIVIGLLLPKIETQYLAYMPNNSIPVLATIPVIFTSFGFYVVIPTLVKYLEGNTKQLKLVFFIGSILPLLLYLIWELTILGNINETVFSRIIEENTKLEGLLKAIQQIENSSIVKTAFNIFASAAILTSFLGVSMALKDYIKDLGKNKPLIHNNTSAILLTFLPPIGFALFYPDGFIIALGYASISLVVLALVMPMLMLTKAQKEAGITPPFTQKITFSYLWILTILIILLQILMAINVIPA
ncbi:aromatic amino acid transport family protein [Myroides pelagicus]|uniref:Tyrosine transporter TyrP n=1 Tax=Myroides pelagicus TaxID=270914 RepID=A0A7K1GL55_9FLAO|nr:aromatic amino acid transport family protein [Myroides pelagicus]MTH29581.1 tyrosine transporter TyrP [Myroides pelagicus]